MSVIRVPADRDTEQQYHQKCCVCHEAVLHTCATMTGLNLFKSSTFVFLCISSFLFTMGVYTPYVFIRRKCFVMVTTKRQLTLRVSFKERSKTTSRSSKTLHPLGFERLSGPRTFSLLLLSFILLLVFLLYPRMENVKYKQA